MRRSRGDHGQVARQLHALFRAGVVLHRSMRSLAILTPVLGNHAARPWPSCSPLPSLLGLLASLPRFTPASASVPVPPSARFATFQQPSTGAVPVSRQSPRSPRHTPQHHPQSVHPVISVTTVTNTLAALALLAPFKYRRGFLEG